MGRGVVAIVATEESNMKHYSASLVFGSVLVGLLISTSIETRPSARAYQVSRGEQIAMNAPCLDDNAILTNIHSLSFAQSRLEQESAKRQLIEDANKSDECRKQIIEVLMRAMDKPLTDLRQDQSRFYLWHYGADILAKLKAEESLDLLIDHFDLDDGTPFPLNHHPAVGSVIRMGSMAIPKLDAVLRQSNDPNSRQYAVFCIASIGGPDAKRVLTQALPSESNKCVKSFITASLYALDGSSLQISGERRTAWYSTFLCNGSGL
jgi:hypothetical protein